MFSSSLHKSFLEAAPGSESIVSRNAHVETERNNEVSATIGSPHASHGHIIQG
jgi:hypothetical protein